MRRLAAELRARQALLLAGLVAVIAVTAAFGAAAALAAGQHNNAELQLARRNALVVAAASAEIGRYVDVVGAIASATGAFENLTAAKFAQVTAPLAGKRLAGATSVVFVVTATGGQVADTQAAWRTRGLPDLRLQPAPGVNEHLFSVFARWLDDPTGRTLTGIDVGQAPAPVRALREARRTGQVTISDAYQLLIDRSLPEAQRQMSFVLTAPVYATSAVTGARTLSGWILMGLRGQKFLDTALSQVSQGLLDVTLTADAAADRPVTVAAVRSAHPGRRDLSTEGSITVADHRWHLHVAAPAAALPGGITRMPAVVAVSGSLLGLLLAGLVWVLATGRARAEARVRTATSDLVAAEVAAREQADLLEAVMNSISDGVVVIDEHRRPLLFNPAAQGMVDLDKHPADRDWAARSGFYEADGITPYRTADLPIIRALDGEHAEQDEMVVRSEARPDPMTLSVSARPLHRANSRVGAVAVFHDVTARKAAEAELAATISDLREREADLRAFAAVAAHDLRAPLSVVAGYADLLNDGLADGDDAATLRPTAARIISGVDRMRRLIEDLLAYATARDGSLNLEPVALRGLVDEVVTDRVTHLRVPGGPQPPLPDITSAALPLVLVDRVMVRQLLDNLIGNALKYTRPGEQACIVISAHPQPDGRTRIDVADRGIGIPPEDRPRVFTSFHRVAQHAGGYPGTGLGLAICHRVVERHGGDIVATDNPGGGTVISFTLPLMGTAPVTTRRLLVTPPRPASTPLPGQ
ncbi:ATP-binding protein [Actinoplanes sp. NPDC026619]|uniref:ATP-binding protein n=1 Tax=Actinoplanes sp. NPDC026619 TaxID=3155798 RepID=UPI0033DF9B4F